MIKENSLTARWMKWSLFNLLIVAAAGALTRYKISFSLPGLEFENLHHAHSHFAFAAWASSALYTLLIQKFVPEHLHARKIYRGLFIANQLTAYGMLISFLFQGYGAVSIIISTLSLFVSYAYAILIWKDSAKNNLISLWSMRFALICLVISSAGPYMLAYMQITHHAHLIAMNNAVYWYLHFQYNGWFLFSVFAIALRIAENRLQIVSNEKLKWFSVLMIGSCIPVYLVSVLWMAPGTLITICAGIGSAIQLIALFFLLSALREYRSVLVPYLRKPGGKLLFISLVSLCVKLVLQFACVFPFLNRFVFGYRPVIIGYLHLIFLGIITCFILGLSIASRVINISQRMNVLGVAVFITGFLLTETALLLQGFSVVIFFSIPLLPVVLFVAAVLMVIGIGLLVAGNRRHSEVCEV